VIVVDNAIERGTVGVIVADNAVFACRLTRSADIRGRSLKLSEIASNFGRSLPSKILAGLTPNTFT